MAASAQCQAEFDKWTAPGTMRRREDVLTSIQMSKMKMCKGSIFPNTNSSSIEKRLLYLIKAQTLFTFNIATPIVSKMVKRMLKIMHYLLQELKSVYDHLVENRCSMVKIWNAIFFLREFPPPAVPKIKKFSFLDLNRELILQFRIHGY